MERMLRFLVTLAIASSAAVAQGQSLRFAFGPPAMQPRTEGGPEIGVCHATELRRVDGDRVLWTRPLPQSARAAIRGQCVCTRSDGQPCPAEVRDYLANPGATALPPGVHGLEELGGRLVLAHGGGLLLLDAQTGALVADDPRPPEGTFFDDAEWELGQCRGSGRGGRIFARCGGALLVFDGARALLVQGRPAQIRERGTPSATTSTRPGTIEITVSLGARVLRIRGQIFTY